MNNTILKVLAGALLAASAAACGDSFLDTEIYNGIDSRTALDNPANVEAALNGTYNRLCNYHFAANYATLFGDICSDLTYWNGDNFHFNTIYTCSYSDTEHIFADVWEYGYKIVDNATRIILACDRLAAEPANAARAADIAMYQAEAYCLRAYAMTTLTNFFGHQATVDGTDFSSGPGVVVVETPIEAFSQVRRASVADCYRQITGDLGLALDAFGRAGTDRSARCVYFGVAAAHALLARVSLYCGDFGTAESQAGAALADAGITSLTCDPAEYRKLYTGIASNPESFITLAIDESSNEGANSAGTLFTTYGYSPSPYLISLYAEGDVRTSIFSWTDQSGTQPAEYGSAVPWFGGGKFGQMKSGNPAQATCYLLCAPEMYLIRAEAALHDDRLTDAKAALLPVARRNPAITSADDLPDGKEALTAFLRDERARELFQCGLRLWDLRRWNTATSLYAYGAPDIRFSIDNVRLGDLIFPVPVTEINSGFGVAQNPSWSASRPK